MKPVHPYAQAVTDEEDEFFRRMSSYYPADPEPSIDDYAELWATATRRNVRLSQTLARRTALCWALGFGTLIGGLHIVLVAGSYAGWWR